MVEYTPLDPPLPPERPQADARQIFLLLLPAAVTIAMIICLRYMMTSKVDNGNVGLACPFLVTVPMAPFGVIFAMIHAARGENEMGAFLKGGRMECVSGCGGVDHLAYCSRVQLNELAGMGRGRGEQVGWGV